LVNLLMPSQVTGVVVGDFCRPGFQLYFFLFDQF